MKRDASSHIVRDVILSRSGVYHYPKSTIDSMMADAGGVPAKHEARTMFGVYRPAKVVADSAPMLASLTLTKEHRAWVTADNWSNNAIGWSGEKVEVVPIPDSKEIGIKSTVHLLDSEALAYYEDGVREVSPGYKAEYRWAEGVTEDGEEYQIVMDAVLGANHLAMCQRGRGGPAVAMDAETPAPGLLASLIAIARDSKTFRETLAELVEHRDEWSADTISNVVEKLKSMAREVPTSNEQSLLLRFIDDFYNIKSVFVNNEEAQEAANLTADLFESLENSDVEDTMDKGTQARTTVLDSVRKVLGLTKDAEEQPAPEQVAKPEPEAAPAPAKDAEPPAPAPEPAPAPAPEAAPAPAITLEMIPDDPSTWSDEQLGFVLKELFALLKYEKTEHGGDVAPGIANPSDAAPAPEAAPAPSPAPEAEPKKPETTDAVETPLFGSRNETVSRGNELSITELTNRMLGRKK